MEISLENLIALNKNETATIVIEDCKGEFTFQQSPKEFEIYGGGIWIKLARPCGGFLPALLAFEKVSDIVGDWPEI